MKLNDDVGYLFEDVRKQQMEQIHTYTQLLRHKKIKNVCTVHTENVFIDAAASIEKYEN